MKFTWYRILLDIAGLGGRCADNAVCAVVVNGAICIAGACACHRNFYEHDSKCMPRGKWILITTLSNRNTRNRVLTILPYSFLINNFLSLARMFRTCDQL